MYKRYCFIDGIIRNIQAIVAIDIYNNTEFHVLLGSKKNRSGKGTVFSKMKNILL